VSSARLLIVSNRLPVTFVREGGKLVARRSAGGLATGLSGPHEESGGLWIGWPGRPANLTQEERASMTRQLADIHTVPVEISDRDQKMFYGSISNGVLWPLCHDRLDQLPLRIEGWEEYARVNAQFAEAVITHYRDGDTIWVHDYHLFHVPGLLRASLPTARIGFFLHIPFPTPEIFLTLPTRRVLIEHMLGADVIGFHTRRYLGHFAAVARRLLGLELDRGDCLTWQGRRVKLLVSPMGIDFAGFSERAGSSEVNAERLELRAMGQHLLVGVDRLDYTKGIPRRMLALEQLLLKHPEWLGKVTLVQVAVPSRGDVGSYQRFRGEIEGLVGKLNGRFGTPTWTPIHYMYRSVTDTTLLALYRAADAMLVTPVRDGMNLVAKEFIASRVDEEGVLVLSEFAGAAAELTDALIVNPYDVDGVADTILAALTMPGRQRRDRMRHLRAHVMANDVHQWTSQFLQELRTPRS
jgi:trehalose 6-phosphate synthase/phosphatase